MKLFHSPASPFVRKVRIVALELGFDLGDGGDIALVPAPVHPVDRNPTVVRENPLGQLPTLLLDDGTALHDSRVICEYLDAQAGGARIFPAPGPARWRALVDQSLADGLLDAALLVRYEVSIRSEEARHAGWIGGQMAKLDDALAEMVERVPLYGQRVDIGTVATGCALGWLDFRYAHLDWRKGREALAEWFARLSERPSFRDTVPYAPS